jgi:hypothetical protein
MNREKIITEIKEGIKQRFIELSEEEKNIIRQNKDTSYGMLLRQILGQELLSGLNTASGARLFNQGGIVDLLDD